MQKREVKTSKQKKTWRKPRWQGEENFLQICDDIPRLKSDVTASKKQEQRGIKEQLNIPLNKKIFLKKKFSEQKRTAGNKKKSGRNAKEI